jgi:hypothetical protein
VAVAIVVIVAAIARATHQAPPPTIAEFAPSSVSQIKEALQNLSSTSGQSGDTESEQTSTDAVNKTTQRKDQDSTKTDSDGVERPRSKRCVRGPDGVLRQIEDPQSPPCIFTYDASRGNGGATTKGVTRDEIRIAVPDADPTADGQTLKDFAAFFNDRFEFYGRNITFIATKPDQTGSSDVNQVERIQATNADEVHHVFASLDTVYNTGANYRDELAHRKIIVTTRDPYEGESQMRAPDHHPYIWSYAMDDETMLRMLGEWICKRLMPYPVRGSTDPTMVGQPRRVGIIMQEIGATRFDIDRYLTPAMAQCNTQLADVYRTTAYSTTPNAWQAPMTRFKVDTKVTSIICLCFSLDLITGIFPGATNQAYFPEWIITPYFAMSNVNVLKLAPKEQSDDMMGITVVPRDLAFNNDPAIWALKEANPNGYVSNGATYDPNSTANRVDHFEMWYRQMLLLASGIQMAGPRLTPQAFEAALHATVFPNPDHPNMEGKVRFTGGVHSMVMDAAEWWWSNTAPSPYNDSGQQNGAWCYVDRGARYRLGAWPGGETGAFRGSCDSGA